MTRPGRIASVVMSYRIIRKSRLFSRWFCLRLALTHLWCERDDEIEGANRAD